MRGGFAVMVYLRRIDPLHQLTVPDLQQVHREMFKSVHPWAGQFRSPGQMTIVAGFPAADPGRIVRELELALLQTRDLAPFINYLGASAGLPNVNGPWRPQFRVGPRFLEGAADKPTFDEDLAWSRRMS